MRIEITGRPGTGKTTIALAMALLCSVDTASKIKYIISEEIYKSHAPEQLYRYLPVGIVVSIPDYITSENTVVFDEVAEIQTKAENTIVVKTADVNTKIQIIGKFHTGKTKIAVAIAEFLISKNIGGAKHIVYVLPSPKAIDAYLLGYFRNMKSICNPRQAEINDIVIFDEIPEVKTKCKNVIVIKCEE